MMLLLGYNGLTCLHIFHGYIPDLYNIMYKPIYTNLYLYYKELRLIILFINLR